MTPPGLDARPLRRVVTGLDATGRSHVASDGGPGAVLESAPGEGLYEIWSDPGDVGRDRATLLPPPGGAKFRWFTVLPSPPGVEASVLLPFYDAAPGHLSPSGHAPDPDAGLHRGRPRPG